MLCSEKKFKLKDGRIAVLRSPKEEDAVEELINMCPEEGVRDLERVCRKLCEAVISKYYVDGTVINSIDSETLKVLLGPIYYK